MFRFCELITYMHSLSALHPSPTKVLNYHQFSKCKLYQRRDVHTRGMRWFVDFPGNDKAVA